MRRGFFNGLITGGLLTAIVALFAAPQFKKERKHLMKETAHAKKRARKVVKGMKNLTEDWMK